MCRISVYWWEDMSHARRFSVGHLTPRGYQNAVVWALVLSLSVVIAAAVLGRAARNMQAALVDKPDIAIYFLLEEHNLGKTTLLRVSDDEMQRDYLAESDEGPMLVQLTKGEEQWYVSKTERLHE